MRRPDIRLTPAVAAVIAALAALVIPRLAAQAPAPQRAGIDVAGMDRSVKPGDNFFKYANGTWERQTVIPADRAAWGISSELAEEANRHTREIIESAGASTDPDARRVADYFAAYMDEAGIEARGLTPIVPALEAIQAIGDRKALADALGSRLRTDVDPLNMTNFQTDRLFGLWVAQDFNDPSHNTAYLLQGGLSLPDREYFVSEAANMREVRAKFKAHVAAVFKLGGVADADAAADRVLGLETKFARVDWNREDSGDVLKANNPWSRDDFPAKAPGLDWTTYFAAAHLDQQAAFIVWQPSAITGEAALVASEPLEAWKDYLRFTTFNRWAGVLPRAFVEERFNFYGKVLSGTTQIPERWKRAMASTNAALGDAVGRMYVAKYFPPEARQQATQMVADIKAAFARRIDRLDWMSASTKAKAREKLETLIVGVGYPDRWRDYSTLAVTRDNALQNAMRAEEHAYRHDLAKLRQPVDRHEWWMTPQTVNAVNLPIQNALNFPAAILQPPYFDPRAGAALNYGAIGATIGHEISHSFDDQGSQFDATGRLANWWQPDDFAHFKAASAKLVTQFNAYKPLPDLSVNGQQTLSENIADVAGLAAAYDAYTLSLKGRPAPAQQGFTGDQRFFLAFAQSWRDKFREPLLRQIVLADGHSPSEYRADTVRNLDQWYAAFGVQPGQALYLAPADRVRVW